jgi:hypothetical protein
MAKYKPKQKLERVTLSSTNPNAEVSIPMIELDCNYFLTIMQGFRDDGYTHYIIVRETNTLMGFKSKETAESWLFPCLEDDGMKEFGLSDVYEVWNFHYPADYDKECEKAEKEFPLHKHNLN